MKKIISSIFIAVLFVSFLHAQSVKKGFKMMEQNLYDKAADAFSKVLSKDPQNAGANLGLALIYFNPKYPYKDYFKSYDYAIAAEKTFSSISSEDSEIIKAYFNLRERRSSKPMTRRFQDKKKEISDKLITDVREENNLQIALKFLEKYPNSPYYENVIHIRNYLKFKTVRRQNTVEGYNAYMKEYPNSAQIPRVIILRDNIAFEEAKSKNTLEAINAFIRNNPNASQVFEAEKIRNKIEFSRAKTANSIEAIDNFLNKYPKASQIPEAKVIKRKLVFERAKRINTLEAYNDFVKQYPYGRYYVDIFNLKANVIGEKLKQANRYPSNNIQWIKGFDNEYKNDIASGIAVAPNGSMVLVGTSSQNDTLGDDAWIMKLDNQGKMIWHKTLGSPRHDKANAVAITPANEIVMAGLFNSSTDTIDGRIWVLKLTTKGEKVWHKSFGITEALTIATTSNGEIIVAGYKTNAIGENKPLIFKLNERGRKLWTRTYTTLGAINSIATTPHGDIAVACNSRVYKLDNKGYISWDTELTFGHTAKAIAISTTGEVFVTGSRNRSDIWVAKFDNAGNKVWEQIFDNFGKTDTPNAICLTPENNILVTGQSNNDSWFFKLNENGNKLYDNFFSSVNGIAAKSVALSRDGKFVIFASQGRDVLNSNYIVIKLIQ